jgi:hypothetical protein
MKPRACMVRRNSDLNGCSDIGGISGLRSPGSSTAASVSSRDMAELLGMKEADAL